MKPRRTPPLLPFFILLIFAAAPAHSATRLPGSVGPRAVLSLVTEGPGQDLYLAFGHSAVRVRDPDRDLDLLFNYGTIALEYFTDPTFVSRFLLGDLKYSLGVHRFEEAFEYDVETQNRDWVEQELNLTAEQANQVYQFLIWNARPENRDYQYDFIKDNCSSRVPLILEKVLGPVLVFPDPVPAQGPTARELIEESLTDRPPWDLLVTLGLGAVADKPLTPRETSFMPRTLYSLFAQTRITSGAASLPLVREERVIYTSTRPTPSPDLITFAGILWLLAVAVLAATLWGLRQTIPSSSRPWYRDLPDRLLFGVVGAGGLLSFYLTFFSLHFAAQGNFHLVWMWPLHLIVAFLPWNRRWTKWYWLLSTIATVAVMVLWPWWPQRSFLAVLAVLLVLAARSFAQFRRVP